MSELLDTAIVFAVQCHQGQMRKAGKIPFIVHPLEVLTLLVSMNGDETLLITGLLHDVLEDTDTKESEILERFGPEVLALVQGHTEDKRHSWKQRKSDNIAFLKTAERREKMLMLADQTANLRSMKRRQKELGKRAFDCFHAPKAEMSWYYRECRKAMNDLAEDKDAEEVFREYCGLIDSIFPDDDGHVPVV